MAEFMSEILVNDETFVLYYLLYAFGSFCRSHFGSRNSTGVTWFRTADRWRASHRSVGAPGVASSVAPLDRPPKTALPQENSWPKDYPQPISAQRVDRAKLALCLQWRWATRRKTKLQTSTPSALIMARGGRKSATGIRTAPSLREGTAHSCPLPVP